MRPFSYWLGLALIFLAFVILLLKNMPYSTIVGIGLALIGVITIALPAIRRRK